MNNKEAGFGIQTREQPVNPEVVWGSDFKIVQIIGLGSGQGFTFDGLNLPREWEANIPKLKQINPEVLTDYCQNLCEPWNFNLEKLHLDKNNVLKEVIIKNNKTQDLSHLVLSEEFREQERGIYVGKNINKIEPAIILQQIGCQFLRSGWYENGYAIISGNPGSMFGSGFGSDNLKIPKKTFEGTEVVTNSHYQQNFINDAHNIAGRFGENIRSIHFTPRGILSSVDVVGDRVGYFLDLDDKRNSKFTSHNVDTPEQAAVLHNIVASHINFILQKENF